MRERGKCQQHSVCWQIDQEQDLGPHRHWQREKQEQQKLLLLPLPLTLPSLKCKRKIAWENFLNFSANIWLLQNKETMWKNNAAASQRIASNEFIYIYVFIHIYKFIYINFLYFLRVIFELMWEGISPQTCESCFKNEGIAGRRDP